MAPTINGRVLYNSPPNGYPEPGKTTVYDRSEMIDVENVSLEGGFLVKMLYLSIDPYMRGRMRDPNSKSYVPPFLLGEPLANAGVGVVLRSEHAAVEQGKHIYGMLPFQEYAVFKDPSEVYWYRVLENKEGLPWSAYTGICGLAGQTAHHGWVEYANPQKGDVVFVSTGAGPVGATVIQLAKATGLDLKVIASAGSDEKVAFMKKIGADVAFNYKKEDTLQVLEREGPINIYWDNVGGSALEAALEAAVPGARFIECGMISLYNEPQSAPKNMLHIVNKELKLSGFICSTLGLKHAEAFYRDFPKLVKEGRIKYTEDKSFGLESAGHAILEVQRGTNTAKKLIVVAEE